MTEQSHFVVVGLGSIGRRHASNLAALAPKARFTFVRHTGQEDEFTRQFEARVVRSIADVSDDVVDLAVLATPSANHFDLLPELIELGWPLLVEKPIVTERQQCVEVGHALLNSKPAARFAAFNLRYLPSLRTARTMVDSGELGRCVRATLIAGQALPTWRPTIDYRSTYSAHAASGGGVELDLSHEFDIARWWFGEMRVSGSVAGTFSGLEINSHDTAVVTLVPVDGPAPVVVVALDYVAPQRVRWYEVVGTAQRLEWNLAGQLSAISSDKTKSVADSGEAFDIDNSYVAMMREVLSAVGTGRLGPLGPQTLADGLSSTMLAITARDWGDPK